MSSILAPVLDRAPSTTAMLIGGAGVAVAATAVAGWMFLRDTFDEQRAKKGDAPHSKWIMDICGGDKFFNSVLKPGFVKTSAKWFVRDLKRLFAASSTAVEGGRWKDATVVTLDGAPTQLFNFRPSQPGRPLILNFGSWT